MCIHTLAIVQVFSTSSADSCAFPLVNAGIRSLACNCPTDSSMLKPQSAKAILPGRSFFKIPQLSVKCLLLTRPPRVSETNDATPCGVIPKSTFTVFCAYS